MLGVTALCNFVQISLLEHGIREISFLASPTHCFLDKPAIFILYAVLVVNKGCDFS